MRSFSATHHDIIIFGDTEHKEAHRFEEDDILAVNAALGARRPLLLRGEPGSGKTHLAIAIAVKAEAMFVGETVDALTSPQDLRWREDAVARLAEAQMSGLGAAKPDEMQRIRERLNRANFVAPGPLWWGFEWETAKTRAAGNIPPQPVSSIKPDPKNGVVVLIDEIDKAPPDVPDALLEALGSRKFSPPGHGTVEAAEWPLVIVTTNNQRTLPDAFVRRCVVHDIKLPSSRSELRTWLISRGEAHFGKDKSLATLYEGAADLLIADRSHALSEGWNPIPGQAEYLDLLRAALDISKRDNVAATELLIRLRRFFLQKRPPIRPTLNS